jgi:hypothetical protein
MLPENRHEDKYRGDEDDGECNLRDRPGRERLDFSFRSLVVFFFVPAREGC